MGKRKAPRQKRRVIEPHRLYGGATPPTHALLMTRSLFILSLLLLCAPAPFARAQVNTLPPELAAIDVDERLGETVDMGLTFVDEEGRAIELRELAAGGRPLLLTLNYYNCPMLCSLQLNALVDTLREMAWDPGQAYTLVTISFDPNEGPALAAAKRRAYLQELGREGADWRFLTGDAAAIEALTQQVGYGYRWVEEAGEWGHPSVLIFLSPQGMVSRYIYGLQYRASDVRLALLEASAGQIGTTIDRIILSCFVYDPQRGVYIPFAMGIMRIGGALVLLLLLMFLSVLWIRDRMATHPVPQGDR